MVKLSDALGAVLKDVAYSRVKSDLFSRDAGLEYLRDPILRFFPVPRVEIRNVEIELAFAVSQLQPEPVSVTEIAYPLLFSRLPDLLKILFSLTVPKARGSREVLPLGERVGEEERVRIEGDLSRRVQDRLRAGGAELAQQLLDRPEGFSTAVTEILATELREAGGPPLSAEVRKRLESQVKTWTEVLGRGAKEATEKTGQTLAMQVAVTRDELADVPQSAIARIKVTADIQNYDWVETEDENGVPAQKLVAR